MASGIRHLLARAGHPQTNGKTGRLFGVMQQNIRPFADTGELVAWWNAASPHMAPNADELETPRGALGRKMPPRGARTVTDEEAGEEYAVSWQAPPGGPGAGLDMISGQCSGEALKTINITTSGRL